MTIPPDEKMIEFMQQLESLGEDEVGRKINQKIWTGWKQDEANRFLISKNKIEALNMHKEANDLRKQSNHYANISMICAVVSALCAVIVIVTPLAIKYLN